MEKAIQVIDATQRGLSLAALNIKPTAKQITRMKQSIEGVVTKKSMTFPVVFTILALSSYMAFMTSASLFQWGLIVAGTSFIVITGIVVSRWTTERVMVRNATRSYIFENFANDNNLSYSLLVEAPEYPGVIFHSGDSRKILDRLYSNDGTFEVGNYEYTIRHNKSRSIYVYGYLRIKLKRKVAHMLLDSKSNNMNLFGGSVSNLPVTISNDQILSLEGDFDKYFTLYAPAEYERDALYVFTPDLMALLIDTIAECDAEVIDDQLFIYGSEFDLMDAATWKKIIAIILTVGEKTIDRTDFYADERVGSRKLDVIAESGKRLRRGIPWMTVLATLLVVIYFIIMSVIHY